MTDHLIPASESTLSTATDAFISARLPDWLARASASQIAALRSRFTEYKASQARVQACTEQLLPLQAFAEQHLAGVLQKPLPAGVTFADLEWRVVTPRFDMGANLALPTYGYGEVRRNGLLQLMSNFPANASFYDGTGLVAPGSDLVLSGSAAQLVRACRALDVGARYQAELDTVFTQEALELLAQDKRAALKLACKVAALKGDISGAEELALSEIGQSDADKFEGGLRAYPGMLHVLGRPTAEGLLIVLRDQTGLVRGVVLYLPGDPDKALRRFDTLDALNKAMAAQLGSQAYRQYFSQLIGLDQRPGFIMTLGLRLQDAHPDLQLKGLAAQGELFAAMATLQVAHVKNDARLLLVPSADAQAAASRARHEAWQSAGLDLLNLAGFFIPVVGALLLGQLVVQTCSEVFEGISDWSRGHQHEALEHLLSVAETVAAGAVTVAGVSYLHSAFIAGLEPVSLAHGRSRLWHFDAVNYQSVPGNIDLLEDGRYGYGGRRWMRMDGRYYEMHRPQPDGPYRLRHASTSGGYGPMVLHNGERSWRLLRDQPLTWQGPERMLDVLWPQHPPIEARQAMQVMQIADVDEDALRGILVENRPTPVHLRQTLRAFQAHARVGTFFEHVRAQTLTASDIELLTWCEGQNRGGRGLDHVLADEAWLRPQLFSYLTGQPFAEDPMTALVHRDFPGLPSAYVSEVVSQASDLEREMARVERRLPVQCAKNARALLRLARLTRGLTGLYLSTAYSDVTGELVLTLLDSFDLQGLDIDLREGALDGRSIKHLGSGGQTEQERRLVWHEGTFTVYDGRGEALRATLGDPGCVFEAVAAALTPEQRSAMQIAGSASASQLRERLLARLPATHWGITRMLGWPEQGSWANPVRRLEHGRIGYPLSGRPGGLGTRQQATVRDQLRALYPSLTEQGLDDEQARLAQGPQPVFERLVQLQDDHEQLIEHLNRWVGAELQESQQAARRLTADSILRAWRLQAEANPSDQGQRLLLAGAHLRTLPALPPQIEFHRITALCLRDSPINEIPVDFLRPFSAMTDLNLSSNRLLRLPLGVGYLPSIRVLRLAHNQIRLDAATVEVLHSLPELVHLDLSYNPLEALNLRFNQLSRLATLNLRHCRLGAWPQRLELCGMLECADLRDNLLRDVPQEIQLMPYGFRRALLVERNPLPVAQLRNLYALDVIEVHGHPSESFPAVDLPSARALWAEHPTAQIQTTREALWQSLQEQPGSDALFRLLARLQFTADYLHAGAGREALMEGVWTLLGALDGDPVLCRQVFSQADVPLSCSDAVASQFSALQIWVRQALAQTANGHPSAQLVELGRQLFRLDQLQSAAYREARQRSAAGQAVDQLAVDLALRVGLRERLNLPDQPRAMRYPDSAQLTQAQIDGVLQRVNRAQTLEALTDSLSRRDFWRHYLRQRHARMFEAIEADYTQRILRVQIQQPALPAAARHDQVENLQLLKDAETQRLFSGLTQSYLRAAERESA
ncbi:NEL-type E3 ubiquitin ligase domain-containing protein [uncultured Pseudomonas sp.]|uniref:NEL-type E3 ubiquitin ligase domain-containing protein n=2 Tax=Pseudomonas TaxID=286 RepID=UPI00258C3522|nr:NEL-type E3 ubiquitin ligase domain-containing protein [uncultured Pseudomonas sp.]